MRFSYVYKAFIIEILNHVSYKEYIERDNYKKNSFYLVFGDEGENSGQIISGIYPGIIGIIFKNL